MNQVQLKQWGILILIGLGLIVLALFIVWLGDDKPQREKPVETTHIDIGKDTWAEEHFVTTYGAQMSALEKDIKALQSEIKRREELAKRNQQREQSEAMFDQAFDETGHMINGELNSPAATPRRSQNSARSTQAEPVKRLAIKTVSRPEAEKPKASDAKERIAQNRTKKTNAGDILITGTFAKAKLLNGVEAPTGGQANGNPMPVLLELTDNAVLPNRYKSRVKRCFVTANATGDLSSERVLVRLDRLSCLTDAGGAIDVKLTGYVTGEDGKTGLKARVVTRSGQAIANALLVGSLSGLGEAVSLAAQDSTTNFAGTVTNTVDDPWRAGLGRGMRDALDRIADYYLRLADKIFPVLEVDAGRDVDIVLTQSASITVDRSIF